uniref:Uncharacterized protein n=1 Tax=Trypanosoma congolense (strain IL3000) TaxID=1068625 RepID=G0UN23_TRYCI|nr:hypothetical protein, unlikely [Trypanosoma congolense IL3000]
MVLRRTVACYNYGVSYERNIGSVEETLRQRTENAATVQLTTEAELHLHLPSDDCFLGQWPAPRFCPHFCTPSRFSVWYSTQERCMESEHLRKGNKTRLLALSEEKMS